MGLDTEAGGQRSSAGNYVAFVTAGGRPRIGTLDFNTNVITAVAYNSGAPVSSLYEVIELGDSAFTSTTETFPRDKVKLLPPLSGRDVLAVGKNYVEHAEEFHSSGFDSSDKNAQPTHPVIFTKRATSIIAHNDEIFPHPDFSTSVDYEGEIGVIVGKPGFRVAEADAMDHVWGYTIINDMTARERQRDHKQFYIGKSADTFCPMGPVAVPKERLPETLALRTYVNGEKRQEADTSQLIFSVPFLIKTLSEGSTLRAGDVIATGTPVGVGFGFRPMKFLKPGDEVSVTVTGLGTLTNKISSSTTNPTISRFTEETHVPIHNNRLLALTDPSTKVGLKTIGSKQLLYRRMGPDRETAKSHIVFLHGLNNSSEYFIMLQSCLRCADTARHLLDFEGLGLSPTSASSTVSIASYAADVAAVLASEGVARTSIVAYGLGCLVAVHLALAQPQLVGRLVLMGPTISPLSEPAVELLRGRARRARAGGMQAVADVLLLNGLFPRGAAERDPVSVMAARLAVLAQHPQGYAKACEALASAPPLDFSRISVPTLFLTGEEDQLSPPEEVARYAAQVCGSEMKVLMGVAHCHVYEDFTGVRDALASFLI